MKLPNIPSTITKFPIRDLKIHPSNAKLNRPLTREEHESLKGSIAAHGQRRPIVVCGKDCASPEGTVLAGEGRWMAAIDLGLDGLDAQTAEGLTADQEEYFLILDNLVSAEHRRYTQEDRYRQESYLRVLDGRGQGARNDLDPSRPTGDTDTLIASQTGGTASQVRQRRKVFGSALVIPELGPAIDEGIVPLSKAAEWVREIEAAVRCEGLSPDDAREELRARTLASCDAFRANGGKKPRKKRARKTMPIERRSVASTTARLQRKGARRMPLGEPPSTALRPTAGDDVHARLTAARSSAAGFVTAFIAATQPPRASAGCSAEELAAYADRLEVVVRVWSELLLVVRPTAGALSAAENLLRALESP